MPNNQIRLRLANYDVIFEPCDSGDEEPPKTPITREIKLQIVTQEVDLTEDSMSALFQEGGGATEDGSCTIVTEEVESIDPLPELPSPNDPVTVESALIIENTAEEANSSPPFVSKPETDLDNEHANVFQAWEDWVHEQMPQLVGSQCLEKFPLPFDLLALKSCLNYESFSFWLPSFIRQFDARGLTLDLAENLEAMIARLDSRIRQQCDYHGALLSDNSAVLAATVHRIEKLKSEAKDDQANDPPLILTFKVKEVEINNNNQEECILKATIAHDQEEAYQLERASKGDRDEEGQGALPPPKRARITLKPGTTDNCAMVEIESSVDLSDSMQCFVEDEIKSKLLVKLALNSH